MKKFVIANVPFLIVIILLNVTIYANSLKGQFVSDDIPNVLNNPQVQSFNQALTGRHRHIQYFIWGQSLKYFVINPTPMHVLSLGLHVMNVVLLFAITYKTFDSKTAVISSLLYSVHPVTTEVVNWISATIYLFGALSLFSTLLSYIQYKQTKKVGYLYLTWTIFAMSVIFTDHYWNYIIAPFLIVFDQLIIEKKINIRTTLPLIPILLATLVLIFMHYTSGDISKRVDYVNTGSNTPFLQRLPYSIYMHGELLAFPKNVTLYHEGEIITPQKYQLMIAISVLIFSALPFVFLKSRKVGGIVLLTYVAVLPIFSPIQVSWFIADRYLYIPAAMFCVLVAMIILGLAEKYKWKNFAVVATVVLLIAYSIRTIMRNQEWQTPKKLWLATERVGPNSPRVHNNLGDVFAIERDYDRSVWHFKRAIELNPNYADALHNLGHTYIQMGQLDLAEQYLLMSLEKNPYLYQATYKLGLIAYNRGNSEEAKGWFEQTLSLSPGNVYAIKALELVNAQTTQ